MTTLSEYFDSRAREMLIQLDQRLAQLPTPDSSAVHRAVRELRGTAQMAREDRVLRAVRAFEAVARSVAANTMSWSEDLAQRARETVADLRVLVERSADDDELDGRVDAVVARWSGATSGDAPTAPRADASAMFEFREFAAREVAAIADELDIGVHQLMVAPRDRQPLKSILQRQRALLGAARLDEIAVVAEILRAVEDLTRVIVKLDVGVKEEWLDIYRVARDGLKNSVAQLEQGLEPAPSNALRRIRHMREELLERYGAGEVVSTVAEAGGPVQATAAAVPSPEHAPEEPELLLLENDVEVNVDDDVRDVEEPELPIGDLVYSGNAALERALALRELIDTATAHDPIAREAVDELFDLIRLARS